MLMGARWCTKLLIPPPPTCSRRGRSRRSGRSGQGGMQGQVHKKPNKHELCRVECVCAAESQRAAGFWPPQTGASRQCNNLKAKRCPGQPQEQALLPPSHPQPCQQAQLHAPLAPRAEPGSAQARP